MRPTYDKRKAKRLARVLHRAYAIANKAGQGRAPKYDTALVGRGWTWLGDGCYSDVFTHVSCPGVVFKINIGNGDDSRGWNEWLLEQTHENLPRVYAVFPFGSWEKGGEFVPGATWKENKYIDSWSDDTVTIAECLSENHSGLTEYNPRVKDIVNSLYDTMYEAGFRVTDLHEGNIMMRGDTIIINDPSTYRFNRADEDDEE